jgi:ABC-2 type transport system ATP-binding protein
MIRLVTGLASPGNGVVTLDGHPIRNELASLARIGHVPDGDGLYDELSAQRFLIEQAGQRGFSSADAVKRADECLDRVGLTDAAQRKAGAFSKGMRQRLKLAQAILHDPDLLVLDEPLTGLDPVMRRDFIRVVRDLGDEGATVLVSSHVLHEIEAMTNSIILLHHGQVLAEGTVQHIRDLLDKYARRIRITTKRPRELGCELLALPEIVEALSIEEHALVVETQRPDRLCSLIQELASNGSHAVSAIEPLDEDLGSVFAYLVN